MTSRPSTVRYSTALNRLAKWRAHFAGWQLGTRANTDPEFQAVRDHRETTIILRAEITALTRLLLAKGIFTVEEYQEAVAAEADLLAMSYEARWPGAHATDDGMAYDLPQAMDWLKDWRP